ncbi:cyclic nucleotide-binding domain-containing protein [Candidatus Magnetaquicoccus inordinatus]|uniref:cyclic nucleotide-binding domain-containing protein n=1 Tax=Candidatus Magnetaquicoccus inordinatus TaxID=2496818 RepID=UPI00102B68A5|nr:cyclic nucleotide-binding domain-containing protein [Candidatus Magnetaquicoccus inordinatus]
MSLIHLFQKTHLLSGIATNLLEQLEPHTQRIVVEPAYNETKLLISSKDSSGPDLYLVLEGEVTLDQEKKEVGLATSREVTSLEEELFGEVSWLLQRPRIADVFTSSRAVLLRINGKAFTQWLQANPEATSLVWQRIATALALRLVQTYAENQSHKELIKIFQF